MLSDHLRHVVTKLTSGLCELDLGISESFLRKLELGRGDACFGDDDDIVLRTPRTICAHTSYFKSTPSYAEVWALGVLASPFHARLALFLMFIRSCASRFGSVKSFLAAPVFCTVFTAFSYYPATCGSAVSSLSSLKQKRRSLRAPKQQFEPQQHSFSTFPHFASNEAKMRSRHDPTRQF